MADSKSRYSAAARYYARIMIHGSMVDAIRYFNSKVREAKFNENWKKNPVNLNEVVSKFTPGVKGRTQGVKYQYENEHFIVKADMPSGYLRIYDKRIQKYIKLDGTLGTFDETHFKIKKRREM